MPCQLVVPALKKVLFLLTFLLLMLQIPAKADSSVTLVWAPSSDPNASGYNVYFGTTSHNYTSMVTVGNTTSATIPGLTPGTTYYFAITTYDMSGNESVFSSEVSYLVPTIIPTTTTMTSVADFGGQFGFVVNGVPGTQYVVQASTNLTDWIAIQTNTAPFAFADTNTAGFAQRFFRLAIPSP
jgi:hypothetical protein